MDELLTRTLPTPSPMLTPLRMRCSSPLLMVITPAKPGTQTDRSRRTGVTHRCRHMHSSTPRPNPVVAGTTRPTDQPAPPPPRRLARHSSAARMPASTRPLRPHRCGGRGSPSDRSAQPGASRTAAAAPPLPPHLLLPRMAVSQSQHCCCVLPAVPTLEAGGRRHRPGHARRCWYAHARTAAQHQRCLQHTAVEDDGGAGRNPDVDLPQHAQPPQ